MIIDTGLLFAADAADVVTTEFHLTRRFKVVVERTFMSLYKAAHVTVAQMMYMLVFK